MHPEKKLWLHFLPVLTAAVVITLLSMITSVGIPYITDSFGLTSRQAPWINTAGTMASAILAPLLGWVGDRRGVRMQLQIGILCAAVSNLICAFTDSFLIFCLGRFLGGISLAAALPAAIPGRKKGGRICRAGGVHLYWLGAWTGNRRASALKNCVEKSLSSQ